MVLIFAWTFQKTTYLHFVAFHLTNKIGLKQTRNNLIIDSYKTKLLFQSLYYKFNRYKWFLPLTKEWTTFMTFPIDFFILFKDKIIGSQTYWIHSFKSRNFHKTGWMSWTGKYELTRQNSRQEHSKESSLNAGGPRKAFCYRPWVIQNHCDRHSECGQTTILHYTKYHQHLPSDTVLKQKH